MISFKRLRDIREDNDISQDKMAKILGVNRSTYSLWELGINIIPLKYLYGFAKYFDVSIDYILSLTNDKKPKVVYDGFDLKILGENMKGVRVSNNLSQEYVASILKVKQPCITRYEKGLIGISTANLYKFCKEFKVSFDIVCGKGNNK